MNGTNRKNFGKSGRSGAVLTLACLFIMTIALVFGFAACGGDDDDEACYTADRLKAFYTAYKEAVGNSAPTAAVLTDATVVAELANFPRVVSRLFQQG